jgi:YidC/Oxa1 family membrane protein insertase
MNDQNRLFTALGLSLIILLGFHYFFEKPRTERQLQAQRLAAAGTSSSVVNAVAATPKVPLERDDVLTKSARVAVLSDAVQGSINRTGARLDDLALRRYHRTLKDKTPVVLLSPANTADSYYVQHGWLATEGVAVPTADTVWEASGETLTPDVPVLLRWDNGEGLIFENEYRLDTDYRISVQQRVHSTREAAVTLYPYSLTSRTVPFAHSQQTVFEGPLGVFEETLKEIDSGKLLETGIASFPSQGGWTGFSDHYWLVALLPDQKGSYTYTFKANAALKPTASFQADVLGEARQLAPGGAITVTSAVFAGAKEVEVLDALAKKDGLFLFDRTIDFGWFYFLTKPMFYLLHYLYNAVGNFGLAIMILTLIVRIVLGPLAHKSFISMNKMKEMQPQVKVLQERYKDDRPAMQKEIMELYKKHQVNPVAGCLPIFLQIPVFFALYKVLLVSIEMRHAPFIGWIHDLAAPDTTTMFNLFGLIAWQPPQFLMIGALPILVGVTMFLSQKLNPPPADPVQKTIFSFMPLLFTYITAHFPAGLAVYWAFNNVLSMVQHLIINILTNKDKKPSK